MKNYATAVTLIAMVAIAGVLGTGCERSRFEVPGVPGVPGTPGGGVTGNWSGTITIGSGAPQSTTLRLTQVGSTVTGTLGQGTQVSGSLSGSQLELDLALNSGQKGHASFTHSGNSLLNGTGYVDSGGTRVNLSFSTMTKS